MENTALEQLIQGCSRCRNTPEIADYMLLEKPSSFYGSPNPKVMIIGHSPSVRTQQEADVVLKMDRKNQPLYQYITRRILDPLGIDIENVYCTNLIKCKTAGMPEDIGIKKPLFLATAFGNCQTLLEMEVNELKPYLILSLSERVLSLMSMRYIGARLHMNEVFGKVIPLRIQDHEMSWVPLVHLPKGANSKVEDHYFPELTERLANLRGSFGLAKV